MSEYLERAVFMRDVQVGDRFKHITVFSGPDEFWTVTGRMDDNYDGKPIVSLVGIYDDGAPASTSSVPWLSVRVQVRVPDTADNTEAAP